MLFALKNNDTQLPFDGSFPNTQTIVICAQFLQ